MGASSSIAFSKINSVNGSMMNFIDSFLSTEDCNRIIQLQQDLVQYESVRMAFASFVWERGMKSILIRNLVLGINETFMYNLLLQDLWEENRDYNSDIIMYYLPIFAQSSNYEPFYKVSVATLQTPPISRSSSFADE